MTLRRRAFDRKHFSSGPAGGVIAKASGGTSLWLRAHTIKARDQ